MNIVLIITNKILSLKNMCTSKKLKLCNKIVIEV